MQEFKEKLLAHVEHIKNVASHCATEETTKQALILPFLNILDFNPFDPQKVKAEYGANLPGIKATERVDYALYTDGHPVMFVEAKSINEKLTNHAGQLARYFNSTPGVSIAAITNGREWRFFTDLKLPNVMDESPFLKVSFDSLTEDLPNEIKAVFNQLILRLKMEHFNFNLADVDTDLFSQIAKEYIGQLNKELTTIYTELVHHGLLLNPAKAE
ncbi:MAG: hypothetical protein A2076_09945 [Geobacteraceae bacterium GWC2_53_11]|nr:MAG: hypothetical protein A2076_09945 [Geobacteraceae bacterium GWC2_53_11]